VGIEPNLADFQASEIVRLISKVEPKTVQDEAKTIVKLGGSPHLQRDFDNAQVRSVGSSRGLRACLGRCHSSCPSR
jgi:hypothetical protein